MIRKEIAAIHKWINWIIKFIPDSKTELDEHITFYDILDVLENMKNSYPIPPNNSGPRQKRISTRDLILEMKQDILDIKQDVVGIKQDIALINVRLDKVENILERNNIR